MSVTYTSVTGPSHFAARCIGPYSIARITSVGPCCELCVDDVVPCSMQDGDASARLLWSVTVITIVFQGDRIYAPTGVPSCARETLG